MVVLRTIVAVVLAVALTEASLQQPPRDGRPLLQTSAALVTQGHEHYKAQEWQKAIEKYEAARDADPDRFGGYFFLAHSYDQLYDPSRAGDPRNDRYLQNAAEYYKTATKREIDPQLRKRALEYLAPLYGVAKLNDPAEGINVAQQLVEIEPGNVSHYFLLAAFYEEAGSATEAERTLLVAKGLEPRNVLVYTTLSGFYNRLGEFPKTMDALERIAELQPRNAQAHQRVAVFYWEKAFRDPRLTSSQLGEYIDAGIAATDRALAIDPDYIDALTYKNILLRMQANREPEAAIQLQLVQEADSLRSRAIELSRRRERR